MTDNGSFNKNNNSFVYIDIVNSIRNSLCCSVSKCKKSFSKSSECNWAKQLNRSKR